jgi:hypothetical protein
MNAKQILDVLDRASVDGARQPDCRRLMNQEASSVRASRSLLERSKADLARDELRDKISTARLTDMESARRERLRGEVDVASERMRASIIEADRVARMWKVI